MDPNLEEKKTLSQHKCTVQVNLHNNKTQATVIATPTPHEELSPNLDFNFANLNGSHRHQDIVGTKFSNSYFRPCLPNEGPLPSTCTPREIWRPCLPPIVLASGKETRTIDKFGSTWAPSSIFKSYHDPQLCTLDRNWILHSTSKRPNTCCAGKLSDFGGSLMFPGALVSNCKVIKRPFGKNVGDILPKLRPGLGDIFILPCINSSVESKLDSRGYVGFVKNSCTLKVDGGIMLLQMLKFQDSTLRTRKQLKLFLLTVDRHWRLKGSLDTIGYLQDPCVPSNYMNVPTRYRRAIRPNTSDMLCIPQRGDVIIREPWKDLFPHRKDKTTSLLWWQPNLELDLNDILVRTCVWNCCDKFEGFVDLYYYNGKGLGWVFLGRDETIFEPIALGQDSDLSDDEKFASEPQTLSSTPYANPTAGNWPLNVPLNASKLSNSCSKPSYL